MGYERELAAIKNFIHDFDPEQFSTVKADLQKLNISARIENAKRCKVRLGRKKRLKQKFLSIDFTSQLNTSDVMITQEQIDELLNQK